MEEIQTKVRAAGEAIEQVGAIYLDYQASTPLDQRVLAAMLPRLRDTFGNPHSTSNSHGAAAMAAIDEARGHVAALIGAEPDEIVFTSGATEANNLLIRGGASAARRQGRKKVVTCVTEHRAVLEVARSLRSEGFDVVEVDVDASGILDLQDLSATVDTQTALVSLMSANNEIGVLHPIAEAAAICRKQGALFHTDAAQAVGKVEIDVASLGCDLLSFSSHKIYGPMGVGAAYVSRRCRRRIDPFLRGGGQEGGLRSGTLPTALCVGLGEACRLARLEMREEAQRLTALRDAFLRTLHEEECEFQVNGAMSPRLPGNLNLSFSGVDAEALLMRLHGRVSIASGAACTTASLEPSYVVLALGFGRDRAEEAARIGFGRQTTEVEVKAAARIIAAAVARLRGVGYRPEPERLGV